MQFLTKIGSHNLIKYSIKCQRSVFFYYKNALRKHLIKLLLYCYFLLSITFMESK